MEEPAHSRLLLLSWKKRSYRLGEGKRSRSLKAGSSMSKKGLRRSLILTVFAAVSAFLLACFAGCGGLTRRELEALDAEFRSVNAAVEGAVSFFDALEGFDFENRAFMDDALRSVAASRGQAEEALSGLQRLLARRFEGPLERLGSMLEDYGRYVSIAVEELQSLYQPLKDLLVAIEPVMREEADITGMEAPRSGAEWLERLNRLKAALLPAVSSLTEMEVPQLLAGLRDLLRELFTVMYRLVNELSARARGGDLRSEASENPDFVRMQELLGSYRETVERLRKNLEASRLDPLVEEVELEINRLFLEARE